MIKRGQSKHNGENENGGICIVYQHVLKALFVTNLNNSIYQYNL